MLQDLYYMGLIVHKGETFQGRHEPIVDAALFQCVQEVIERRSQPQVRDRTHGHYLRGFLRCGRCAARGRESRLIYTQSRGHGGTYEYFKCSARFHDQCDLPHLPVLQVEWAVSDHYATLGLRREFLHSIRDAIQEGPADTQRQTKALHVAYRRELAKLDQQEERLIDLATDGAMPRERIKDRLHAIRFKRAAAEDGPSQTDQKLEVGAAFVSKMLDLLDHPGLLYKHAHDDGRRDLISAAFERLYIDEDGVNRGVMTPLVKDLHDAAKSFDSDLSGAANDAPSAIEVNARNEKLPDTNAEESSESQFEALFRGIWNRNLLVRIADSSGGAKRNASTV